MNYHTHLLLPLAERMASTVPDSAFTVYDRKYSVRANTTPVYALECRHPIVPMAHVAGLACLRMGIRASVYVHDELSHLCCGGPYKV